MPKTIEYTEGSDVLNAAVDLYRTWPEGVILKGQGRLNSMIYQAAGLNAPALYYSSVTPHNVRIQDLYIDGARATNPTGTIGIDATNIGFSGDTDEFRGVEVWHCSSHGLKNAAWVSHCASRENTGSGFYNDTVTLMGHHVYTSHNEQYGYRLYIDSILTHFRADEDAIGIYLPDACFPITIGIGEITMSDAVAPYTVPSTIGIQFNGGNPSYIVKGVNIDVSGSNMTGVKLTNNTMLANIEGVTIRGRDSGVSGQILFDCDSVARSLFSNIVLASTNGTALRLDEGDNNRFNNVQILDATTPIDLVAGNYLTNWRMHQLKMGETVPANEYVSENGGSATITAGQTFVAVTHGLVTTPNIIKVTALEAAGVANFVGTVGASTFRINITGAAGADTHFYWQAKVSP